MHPRNLSIQNFDYSLPESCIAYYPLPERSDSRLLIYKQDGINEDTYANLASYLPSNSLLLFNNSKVVEARLLFQKPSGGFVEIFCLEPAASPDNVLSTLHQKEQTWWKCLIGGASKWKHGQILEKTITEGIREISLKAAIVGKSNESFIVEFSWSPADLPFVEIMHAAGAIPLPPYIKRPAEKLDFERYQTVYAKDEGSVAAPTAGLHFTPELFASLDAKEIQTDFVTLHVGAGTFKPVKSETIEDHEMHAESLEVSRATIERILRHLPGPVVAIGTTSLRTIESLYWIGVKIKHDPCTSPFQLNLSQWEPYDLAERNVTANDSLQALLHWMIQHGLWELKARTQILIAPGYEPAVASCLITNFHQPRSTLLLLVAALVGDDWQKIYQYALENGFRFLSYGDGCLLWFR